MIFVDQQDTGANCMFGCRRFTRLGIAHRDKFYPICGACAELARGSLLLIAREDDRR